MNSPEETCTLREICAQLEQHSLPLWQQLPELDLYMDQVLSLVGRYLGGYPGFDSKGLTASMVNNYVKQGVLAPPKKKRYSRTHLAQLLVICLLKASLPIAAIRQLTAGEAAQSDPEAFYSRFRELFEQTNREVSAGYSGGAAAEEDFPAVVCRAALRAQAEQALAARLCAADN